MPYHQFSQPHIVHVRHFVHIRHAVRVHHAARVPHAVRARLTIRALHAIQGKRDASAHRAGHVIVALQDSSLRVVEATAPVLG